VGVLAVGADDGEVAFDHIEVGVAKEDLEGEGVASVAEVGDGEGVTEAVGVDFQDASSAGDAAEEEIEVAGVHRPGEVGGAYGEEGVVVAGVLQAGGEVAPEGAGGAAAEVDGAFLFVAAAAFAADGEGVGGEIEVGDGEVAEFGTAEAGVEQDEDDGAVAVGGGTLGFGVLTGFPGAGVVAGFEEGLDVFFAEGIDARGLKLGRVDGADDVFVDIALVDAPGPEGAECDVDVVYGFGCEVDLASGSDAVGVGYVVVLEPGEERDDLGAGDFGEGGIVGEEEEEFVVTVLVVEDGVARFAGGGFVEDTALDGLRECKGCHRKVSFRRVRCDNVRVSSDNGSVRGRWSSQMVCEFGRVHGSGLAGCLWWGVGGCREVGGGG